MKKLIPLFAFIVLLGSCINDQENVQIIHDRDLKAIEDYLRDTPIPSVRTEQDGETGIVIMWVEENTDGRSPDLGDSLWVNYTGSFLDGRVFDTSIDSVAREHGIHNPNRRYEPFGVSLGITGLIPGFNFALYNMKEGDKTVVLIPSSYAYGRQGSGSIPSNTPLRFDLDMIKVAEEEPEIS
jgi:FKBP-type peptidyl-prolyl cis-trans isomerase FkpA